VPGHSSARGWPEGEDVVYGAFTRYLPAGDGWCAARSESALLAAQLSKRYETSHFSLGIRT